MQAAQVAPFIQFGTKWRTATVTYGAAQKVDLSEFMRGERPFAETTFAADERPWRPEEIRRHPQKAL